VQASGVGLGVIRTDHVGDSYRVGEVTPMQSPSGLDLAWGTDRDNHIDWKSRAFKVMSHCLKASKL